MLPLWLWLGSLGLIVNSAFPEQAGQRISIELSQPAPAEKVESMRRWRTLYEGEMRLVRLHWQMVVDAIHQGRISALPELCPDFRAAVAAMDREALVGVEDAMIRANLARAFELLDGASVRCDRSRFFALSFQLYKARYVIEAIDRRARTLSAD